MTDHPILFSAPMVRALLDGTKTQTRRIAKFITEDAPGDFSVKTSFGGTIGMSEHSVAFDAPHFAPWQIGDRLWVRETWRTTPAYDGLKPSDLCGGAPLNYLADDGYFNWAEADGNRHGKTRVAIHMPRWASRLTLTVTDVRVERLQDISEADAIAEGISEYLAPLTSRTLFHHTIPENRDSGFVSAKRAFQDLWNSINGDGAWEQNPWVVALTFNVMRYFDK